MNDPQKKCRLGTASKNILMEGTEQPAHLHSLISTFVIRLLENILSKLVTGEISTCYTLTTINLD